VETLRTIEFHYSSFPNSDDSRVDRYDITPTQNRSALEKSDMVHYLPENWWDDPFKIIGTGSGDKPQNNSASNSDIQETDLKTMPESFKKKYAEKNYQIQHFVRHPRDRYR
tara:strand:+ start:381 stop:713 length:333 start_codon:yes stop_codon:yes gene_type:complete